jgi:hypothetical protein
MCFLQTAFSMMHMFGGLAPTLPLDFHKFSFLMIEMSYWINVFGVEVNLELCSDPMTVLI